MLVFYLPYTRVYCPRVIKKKFEKLLRLEGLIK